MGIVTFEKLKLDEVEAFSGMVEDVINNSKKIKGYNHNIGLLEKKLGTASDTHYIVARDSIDTAKFKYTGLSKAYMYEVCKKDLEKEILEDKLIAMHEDISKLPIITKKRVNRAKLAYVCNEFIMLSAYAIEYNNDIMKSMLITLIRKCDSHLAMMLLEDHIDDIVSIFKIIIDNVSVGIYKTITLEVTNECMNLQLGKDVVQLLVRMFNAYRIFGKNIHEMLLKGLNDYLDSNCVYLTRGDI